MGMLMLWVARGAGLIGALLFIAAFAVRATGVHWVAGMQVGSALILAIALMALGCLCYLAQLVEFRSNSN